MESSWKPEERPERQVLAAYRLAKPFGPFRSVIEFGTDRRLAGKLVSRGGHLMTTSEPLLGTGKPPDGKYELVIALHVLEHCQDLEASVVDLWAHSERMLLVEVPALEVETAEQAFDDINPGHLHHLSMDRLVNLLGGTVMACEAVRFGAWPCNRLLVERGEPSLTVKKAKADSIYRAVAEKLRREVEPGDAYIGDGYSLKKLLECGAPVLPVYDTHKAPVPADFRGSLIITPRYGPTQLEMLRQYGLESQNPWRP
jgi:hypothetical protein